MVVVVVAMAKAAAVRRGAFVTEVELVLHRGPILTLTGLRWIGKLAAPTGETTPAGLAAVVKTVVGKRTRPPEVSTTVATVEVGTELQTLSPTTSLEVDWMGKWTANDNAVGSRTAVTCGTLIGTAWTVGTPPRRMTPSHWTHAPTPRHLLMPLAVEVTRTLVASTRSNSRSRHLSGATCAVTVTTTVVWTVKGRMRRCDGRTT